MGRWRRPRRCGRREWGRRWWWRRRWYGRWRRRRRWSESDTAVGAVRADWTHSIFAASPAIVADAITHPSRVWACVVASLWRAGRWRRRRRREGGHWRRARWCWRRWRRQWGRRWCTWCGDVITLEAEGVDAVAAQDLKRAVGWRHVLECTKADHTTIAVPGSTWCQAEPLTDAQIQTVPQPALLAVPARNYLMR